MRTVLDPNVLIAALLSPQGAPAQIVSRWLAGEFEIVVSESLLAELERTLAYPKIQARIASADAAASIALIREGGALGRDPAGRPRRSADPDDDYLLALAESERAVLVSGDAHLLDLGGEFPIQSPRGFLELLDS